jgi:hypothetical protein
VTLTGGIGFLSAHPTAEDFKGLLIFSGAAIVFAVASIVVFFVFRNEKRSRRPAAWRKLVLAVLMASAGLVFSTLFLPVAEIGSGWAIVLGKSQWITDQYNVAGSWSGPGKDWLQAVYGPIGHLVYLISLAATVAMAGWLVFVLASSKHLRSSRILACFAATFNFIVFWVYTDIFWGWHYLSTQSAWSGYLASALWLAAPAFVLVLLLPVALRQGETWRPQTLLILQLPVAVFNYLLMPLLFERGEVYLPGLGVLMIGLQLESWACTALMILQDAHKEHSDSFISTAVMRPPSVVGP